MAKHRTHSTTDPRAPSSSHRSALDAALRAERASRLGLAERRATIADAAVQAGLATLGVGPEAASAGADLLGLIATYDRPTEGDIGAKVRARIDAGKARDQDFDAEIHRLRIQSERNAVRASAAMALGAMVDRLLASED